MYYMSKVIYLQDETIPELSSSQENVHVDGCIGRKQCMDSSFLCMKGPEGDLQSPSRDPHKNGVAVFL